MNIKIIKGDSKIMVDGEPLIFNYTLTDNIAAIQWDGSNGHIEFNDGTHNETITDFSDYQYLVDTFNTEKQRVADEISQTKADNIASYTYAEKRKQEYDKLNQWEMHFDDNRDGTTTWVDSINEIKVRFPK